MTTSTVNTTAAETTVNNEAVAGNFYSQPTYGAPQQPQYGYQGYGYNPYAAPYQPQTAPAGTDPKYFQGGAYTTATPADFGFANPYAAPQQTVQAQAQWNYTPAAAVRGQNPISQDDIDYMKSNKDDVFLKITREEDIQARCMHKHVGGQEDGLIAGGEIPGTPGSWHCPVCEAQWMVSNCSSADFDKLLSVIYNVVQTDKLKMTNVSPAVVDGIFKSLPALKLLSKVHKIAEADFQKTKSLAASKLTASPAWGGNLTETWINNSTAGFQQFGAPQQPQGYYAAPQQPQGYYAAPQQPQGYYAAPQQPVAPQYGYGAPQQPTAPQYGCPGSPLVAAGAPQQPTPAPAPAPAPAAASTTTTTTYTPVSVATPDPSQVVTSEQKI